MIASILIMLTLGGSVATTAIPPSFVALQDPGLVKVNHDLNALSVYYNTTLAQVGAKNFDNASFLLDTFRFVNIPPSVNATAQLANSDLTTVNKSAANATVVFHLADLAIRAKEYVNATFLVNEGCALAQQANSSLADFQGPQTSHFKSEGVPVAQYAKGSAAASAMVKSLLDTCSFYRQELSFAGLVLLIGSPQTSIETGGTVRLVGNLTFRDSPVGNDEVLFYVDGSYFGSLTTSSSGDLSGTLRIPFIYSSTATVQALVRPNSTLSLGGATSNTLLFEILFNQTAIVVGDPPAVLPTFSFNVHGNLTTVSGVALPDAPVRVTFFNQSEILHTNSKGAFATRLTVPAYASDGVYNVYASFAPQGVFGPSFNFTSIQVVHLPLNVTVDSQSLSFAGFSTTLTGTAHSNGSAVAGATVRVDSPWGSVITSTDPSGGFRVTLPVSPLEFAFSRDVSVSAAAPQPYIADAQVAKSLKLFNFLLVVLPVAAIGIVAYEADKLGVFEGLRNRSRKEEAALAEISAEVGPGAREADVAGAPELLRTYRRALKLASAKYSLRFRPSLTIREIVSMVAAKGSGQGVAMFEELLLTVEDFIYAPGFDPSRVDAAKRRLAELEVIWK